MSRRAFTLVELMIVVVLMALLTTAAALTFARPLRAARWEQVVAQVRNGDESARTVARRFDREATIVFDLTANTMARREGRDVKWQQPLPRAFHVEQIRLADGSGAASGTLEIPVSSLGITQTYAVRVTGAEPGQDRWLVFAGLTGQVTQVNDEAAVDSIFGAVADVHSTR